MSHKYTKILIFCFIIISTACGTGSRDNTDDYTEDNKAADIENEENLEYRPEGDYDTLTNAEKIAKDRRNHRKIPKTDSGDDNASTEENIQTSQDRNTEGSNQDQNEEAENGNSGNYPEQKQEQTK